MMVTKDELVSILLRAKTDRSRKPLISIVAFIVGFFIFSFVSYMWSVFVAVFVAIPLGQSIKIFAEHPFYLVGMVAISIALLMASWLVIGRYYIKLTSLLFGKNREHALYPLLLGSLGFPLLTVPTLIAEISRSGAAVMAILVPMGLGVFAELQEIRRIQVGLGKYNFGSKRFANHLDLLHTSISVDQINQHSSACLKSLGAHLDKTDNPTDDLIQILTNDGRTKEAERISVLHLKLVEEDSLPAASQLQN